MSEQAARRIERAGISPGRERFVATSIIDKTDYPIKGPQRFIVSKRPGLLREMILKTTSEDFAIQITLDENKVVERTYSEISVFSDFSGVVNAYEALDGSRIMVIANMSWINTSIFLVRPTTIGEIVFNSMFIAWDEIFFETAGQRPRVRPIRRPG